MGYSPDILSSNGEGKDNKSSIYEKRFWSNLHERVRNNRLILHTVDWVGYPNEISWRDSRRKNNSGESIEELILKIDVIVTTIEETKDISMFTIDELHSSLMTHE